MVLNNDFIISVVIPIYNEEKNVPVLTEELTQVLQNYHDYEIIYINDGSDDNSQPGEATAVLEDEAEHIAALRPEGHPDADLPRATGNQIGKHTEQPHGRQRQ